MWNTGKNPDPPHKKIDFYCPKMDPSKNRETASAAVLPNAADKDKQTNRNRT